MNNYQVIWSTSGLRTLYDRTHDKDEFMRLRNDISDNLSFMPKRNLEIHDLNNPFNHYRKYINDNYKVYYLIDDATRSVYIARYQFQSEKD